MASVIDTLLIELGLDTSKYQKGQKEAEGSLRKLGKTQEEQTKKINESSKTIAEGFNKARNELVGLAAAAVGARGVGDFISNLVKTQPALGRAATDLNMNIKSLQAWGRVSEYFGGNFDDARQTFQKFAGEITKFSLGMADPQFAGMLTNLLKQSGKTIYDQQGKLKDFGDIYLDLQEILHKKYEEGDVNGKQQVVYAAELLGITGGMNNALRSNTKEVKETLSYMQQLSGSGDKLNEQTNQLNKSWTKIKQITEIMAIDLATGFFDVMEAGFKKLDSWVQASEKRRNNLSPAVKKGMPEFFVGSDLLDLTKVPPKKPTAQITPQELQTSTIPSNAKEKLEDLDKQYGFATGTMARMWQVESSSGKHMLSKAGATGHFQFMPDTAKDEGLSRSDTFDFNKSSRAAANYLSKLLKHYRGDMQKALVAYNWGVGNLDKKGMAFAPLESQNYYKQFTGLGAMNTPQQPTNNSSEVHIGTVNVQTQATDANGVAKDMNTALQKHALITNSATGMQ